MVFQVLLYRIPDYFRPVSLAKGFARLEFAQTKRGKNKTGANVSLYTVFIKKNYSTQDDLNEMKNPTMYSRALKSNAINLYILKQLPRIKKDKHKENSIN